MTTYEDLKLFCKVEVTGTAAIGRVVSISADAIEGVEIEFLGEESSFYPPEEIDITDDSAALTYEFPFANEGLIDWKAEADALQAENKRLKDVLRCARDWRDIDDKSMDEGIYICNRLFDAIDACNDIQLADEATETKE